jgi:branched-chain amino acid transport system permease protein
MTKLLQALMDGVAVGSLYALIALGYTMVYGILKFINFAHSDVFMLGAWFSFAICGVLGYTTADHPVYAGLIALVGSMAMCGALGFTVERLAYRPLRGAPRINVLITAIGVSLLLENVGQLEPFKALAQIDLRRPGPDNVLGTSDDLGWLLETGIRFPFGTRPTAVPLLLPEDWSFLSKLFAVVGIDLPVRWMIAGVNILPVDVLVIGVAFTLMGLLQWLVFGTSLGRAMRAVSYDTRTASLMGIDVDRVISFTFVIGSALAAAAGFLYGQKIQSLRQSADGVWILLGLKAFVAAVVGGIGNVRGAMAGGLMIGLVEQFGAAYLSTNLRDLYVFTLLIIVLLFKPEGLLGKATVEKV